MHLNLRFHHPIQRLFIAVSLFLYRSRLFIWHAYDADPLLLSQDLQQIKLINPIHYLIHLVLIPAIHAFIVLILLFNS